MNQKSQSDSATISDIISRLRSIAVHSLAKMYRPGERMFAFCLKRNIKGEILHGVSRRYTAIALIGLAGEEEYVVKKVLANHDPKDVCEHLLKNMDQMKDLGEIILTTWAARLLESHHAHKAVETLRKYEIAKDGYSTIELSWALTALIYNSSQVTDMALAKSFAEALMDSFNQKSNIFLHGPSRKGLSSICSHVSCFADFVYPIQALSCYYRVTRCERAAEIACRCAEHMCTLQGPDGQWWWHFDNRTGRVLEQYPVYSVHQDSMAPMALFALAEACGKEYSGAIRKSLNWLMNPHEIAGSLIDVERQIIWRKIARRESFRMVRKLQAAASYLHSSFRAPGVDVFFPPVSIDYESRPYHMGWILHVWSNGRATMEI